MIVPEFWAEASRHHRAPRRSVTIRRFGWSDATPDDAQAMAEIRADEALARHLAGEAVRLRDHKRAYNGAEGLPIREEVLERDGDAVITRNLYGARCLNVPDVLFADVDFAATSSLAMTWVATLLALATAAVAGYFYGWKTAVFAAALVWGCARAMRWVVDAARGPQREGAEPRARARIDGFVAAHPDWHLRLYRTPA
jgi:hypothetical protein